MNAKLSRKVRKSVNSAVNAKEKEMVEEVFNYLDSLPFRERVRIAIRLIKGKL
jgi:hypothetical protein